MKTKLAQKSLLALIPLSILAAYSSISTLHSATATGAVQIESATSDTSTLVAGYRGNNRRRRG